MALLLISFWRSTLAKLVEVCSAAIPTNAPKRKDHTKEEHQFKSLYGSDWEGKMAKSELSQYCCVTTMITHMVKESTAVYKGTEFEDTWRCSIMMLSRP